MKSDLEMTFTKLVNPRTSAGLIVLHSLLDKLKGPPVPPKDIRETIDRFSEEKNFSKQSITNAARRLEEVGIVARDEGYSVNYGYLLSVMLNALMQLSSRVGELEEDLAALRDEVKNRG
ncbi:MAG: hypothetical protein HXY34_03255 [Candidatus Thorarchaeota archaeon]|nr:hypothetical protein [Candidatus Thorarchaeota archaeon]